MIYPSSWDHQEAEQKGLFMPQWFVDLILKDSTAHTVFVLGLAIFPGIWLGNIAVRGIKIGVAGVLFSGLLIGSLPLPFNDHVLHFIREFGLILFVFSIGLQVGPGFFSNFKESGLRLNTYAAAIVLLGMGIALIIKFWFNIPVDVMVGILSGAVTNTPGLGAAQQALKEIPQYAETSSVLSGTGYAVTYPFGIMGIIITMILIKKFFNIKIEQEAKQFQSQAQGENDAVMTYTVEITNPMVVGKTIGDLGKLLSGDIIISRHFRAGLVKVAHENDTIELGDLIHFVCTKANLERALTLVGGVSVTDIRRTPSDILVWKILVTKTMARQSLAQYRFRERFDVVVTRVLRHDTEIIPSPTLILQVGDQLTAVGQVENLKQVSKELGDSKSTLVHPNLMPVFLGIVFGVILGSVPLFIPGLPTPVKLGMAGGPLLVALIMGYKGSVGNIHFQLPHNVRLFMREFGIMLFLAAVGLSSGENFFKSLMSGTGYTWMLMGACITLIPILLVGFIARKQGLNYLSLAGLLAGSMTDPPALGYANSLSESHGQSTAYASVYPLTMFLRILTAQIFVMICLW